MTDGFSPPASSCLYLEKKVKKNSPAAGAGLFFPTLIFELAGIVVFNLCVNIGFNE